MSAPNFLIFYREQGKKRGVLLAYPNSGKGNKILPGFFKILRGNTQGRRQDLRIFPCNFSVTMVKYPNECDFNDRRD